MRLLIILTLFIHASVFAQVPVTAAEPQANPAPTPPLQWVNSSISQMNNNLPMAQATPVATPEPQYQPNQQAQMQQQQQQVPDVTLPYPVSSP